ncbi:O-antigen ligase family protein [Pricia sp. S334]|uniref:O-antigen ligase family protein n=1 Tax=Pricia mediterranea TaxID=3076079 RepID=A0ABU3L5D2_9FLAO|nr:O-antigen ligase family protein [Pricia sp. S334]MDT7828934.1 O-antigen ligase family protein [Pricia sp. S334]
MSLDKIKTIALFFLVASIPFARVYNINSYAVAVLSALYLFSPRQRFLPHFSPSALLFFLYYFILAVNLLVIEQPQSASTLVKYLPLVLIPFSLSFIKYQKRMLFVFVYTVIAACLISIITTYIRSKGYIFYYHDPTEIIDLQLNYLAIFVCFTLAILYSELITANVVKLEYYFFIPFLFFSLAVFYNRTSIIVALVLTVFFIIAYLKKKGGRKFLIGFIAFFVLTTIWMANRPIVQSKFKEVIQIDLNDQVNYNNGIYSRMLSWECSWQHIKTAGFFGTGINNSSRLLTDCYEKEIGGDAVQVVEAYNAHNQFLQTTLDLGYLGLLILLLIYARILYIGIRKKDTLLLFFFTIMLLFGMTESFMIRQWGSVFFVFFTSYLLHRWRNTDMKSYKSEP